MNDVMKSSYIFAPIEYRILRSEIPSEFSPPVPPSEKSPIAIISSISFNFSKPQFSRHVSEAAYVHNYLRLCVYDVSSYADRMYV